MANPTEETPKELFIEHFLIAMVNRDVSVLPARPHLMFASYRRCSDWLFAAKNVTGRGILQWCV